MGRSSGCRRRWSGATPFPGPGLAIRIIGEVTRERLEVLREADAILLEEVRKAILYRELWQCFAVLPAIRSVGVQGDERTYGYPVVIRAVTSEDAMTADWARLPYDPAGGDLQPDRQRDPGVNRVALDLTRSRLPRSSGSEPPDGGLRTSPGAGHSTQGGSPWQSQSRWISRARRSTSTTR